MKYGLISALVLVALSLVGAFVYWPKPVIASDDYEAFQSIIKSRFSDPASIQLDKVRAGSRPHVYCGEVNAKNLYGGYVGFIPFVADVHARYMYLMDPNAVSSLLPKSIGEFIQKKDEITEKTEELQRQVNAFKSGCQRVN